MTNDEHDATRVCRGCGTVSPETNTEFTLISSKFGWRLSRSAEKDGRNELVWRCPACWQDFKATGGRL
jgi:hypothetical protein